MIDSKRLFKALLEKIRVPRVGTVVSFIVLLMMFPFLVRNDSYILHITILALVFAILTSSWNLIGGYTGIPSLSHHTFFGIGAYVSALLAIRVGISPWIGLFVAGGIAGLFGLALGTPCLRLKGKAYIVMMTIAFASIVEVLSKNLVDITGGEYGLWVPPFPDIPIPGVGVINLSGAVRMPYYYIILVIFLFVMYFLYTLIGSRIGFAFRAIHESEETAESVGINTTKYKLLSFFISSALAGIAGSTYAHYILAIAPSSVFGISRMLDILAMTVIGGIGSFFGPMIGAFAITILLEGLRAFGGYRLIVYGILFVTAIILMPGGIARELQTIYYRLRKLVVLETH